MSHAVIPLPESCARTASRRGAMGNTSRPICAMALQHAFLNAWVWPPYPITDGCAFAIGRARANAQSSHKAKRIERAMHVP
jgi:hypothetical protein